MSPRDSRMGWPYPSHIPIGLVTSQSLFIYRYLYIYNIYIYRDEIHYIYTFPESHDITNIFPWYSQWYSRCIPYWITILAISPTISASPHRRRRAGRDGSSRRVEGPAEWLCKGWLNGGLQGLNDDFMVVSWVFHGALFIDASNIVIST
jgi:hypothetical protein